MLQYKNTQSNIVYPAAFPELVQDPRAEAEGRQEPQHYEYMINFISIIVVIIIINPKEAGSSRRSRRKTGTSALCL